MEKAPVIWRLCADQWGASIFFPRFALLKIFLSLIFWIIFCCWTLYENFQIFMKLRGKLAHVNAFYVEIFLGEFFQNLILNILTILKIEFTDFWENFCQGIDGEVFPVIFRVFVDNFRPQGLGKYFWGTILCANFAFYWWFPRLFKLVFLIFLSTVFSKFRLRNCALFSCHLKNIKSKITVVFP